MSVRPARTSRRVPGRHTGHAPPSILMRDHSANTRSLLRDAIPALANDTRRTVANQREWKNSNARRHFKWTARDPLQCLGSRVNQVAWQGAGLRSQRRDVRKPIVVSEKLTTRLPLRHVRELRRWRRRSARPPQTEISNSFGVAAKMDSRGFATSHANSRSCIAPNVPCFKSGMNWSTRCDESTCRGRCSRRGPD